jgi:hypothetical protein
VPHQLCSRAYAAVFRTAAIKVKDQDLKLNIHNKTQEDAKP